MILGRACRHGLAGHLDGEHPEHLVVDAGIEEHAEHAAAAGIGPDLGRRLLHPGRRIAEQRLGAVEIQADQPLRVGTGQSLLRNRLWLVRDRLRLAARQGRRLGRADSTRSRSLRRKPTLDHRVDGGAGG